MSLGKRVDRPSYRQPETTGKGKLGVGKSFRSFLRMFQGRKNTLAMKNFIL
jgi:hypothetical protein